MKRRLATCWRACCCTLLLLATVSLSGPAARGEAGFTKGDWPFQPLTRPATPEVANAEWAVSALDRFILAALEQQGLTPNQPADKATLLRRVTFDLTGLPPKLEEVQAFLADDSPESYERVVERLLASPRYGERWARHWLDVVRFADTAGFKTDFLREEAYRYRDYVIRAMNTDLPYDQFVRQQIAGDELEPGNPEALIATGFLRLYPQETTAADFVKHRQDVLDDVTEVTGLAFLALTLGCAKCHDHKFDPIEQSDFFRLEACFSGIVPRDDLPPVTPDVLAAYEKKEDQWEDATRDIRRQIDELTDKVELGVVEEITVAYDPDTRKAWFTPEAQRTTHQQQLVALSFRYIDNIVRKRVRRLEGELKAKYDALQQQLAKYDALKPAPLPTAMAVSEGAGPAPPTHVLDAGDYRKPEERVSAGFPVFLGRSEPVSIVTALAPSIGGRRAALARWLTLPDHPLTARVMANRLWQHHFGQGIIASSNDFGAMGDAPSHPALLDWLACELVEKRWSLKALHRTMVLSATYRQSSRVDPQSATHQRALTADPGNRLLWHARRQRLEAEAVRDSLYALSGRLDETMFGPSVYPKLPDSLLANSFQAWLPDPSLANRHRRSVYGYQKRNLRHPLLASFDQPDLYLSCGVRANTLTPTQSLALFNGDEAAEQAAAWAGRLLERACDDGQFVRQVWLDAYSRPPGELELAATRRFLSDQAERTCASDQVLGTSLPQPCPSCLSVGQAAAYVDLCHAVLNSSEFLYRD